MLELKKISKTYITGNFRQKALNEISIKFRKTEFVAILGASGSGKTTLLNIIGGLDKYDTGDLIINNNSTTKFKPSTWDAYRNNSVGFIFQSYNLISHISILSNIEMSLILSGVKPKARKKRATEALKKVGLEKHLNKKPNQLSGGQMQRVAIARALVNDPDVILADEPTGALDSNTSIQIMDLIKKISKEKLVIMVTHNQKLANQYANRIIELKDGKLISDSNPTKKIEKEEKHYKIKKTSMSFLTALKLSFNNIKTKKGRTFLTAFASSIGIIGISLILALSNGFNIEINNFEKDTLSALPIVISAQSMDMNEETINKIKGSADSLEKYPNNQKINVKEKIMDTITHQNNISKEYIQYIEKMDSKNVAGISYIRGTNMNIISKVDNTYQPLIIDQSNFVSIPNELNSTSNNIIKTNYNLLYGKEPENPGELLLVLNNKNQIDRKLLTSLGIKAENKQIDFSKINEITLKLIFNNNYYIKNSEYYIPNNNYEELYNSKESYTLKVVGIIRCKEEKDKIYGSISGLYYPDSLIEKVIDTNKNSDIVLDQKKSNNNLLTREVFDTEATKNGILSYLGADTIPYIISIYPTNFDAKEEINKYLNNYNKNKSQEEKIIYNDLGSTISSLSGGIMDAVTIVLIAFSSISLIVSVIMISIITYISVLERTKEIGILRSLGARAKDISHVFNAETFIIGMLSGIIGILIARILIFPANVIILKLTELKNVAKMNPIHVIILITISVTLTVIGGYIPALIASKRNPVNALRCE